MSIRCRNKKHLFIEYSTENKSQQDLFTETGELVRMPLVIHETFGLEGVITGIKYMVT